MRLHLIEHMPLAVLVEAAVEQAKDKNAIKSNQSIWHKYQVNCLSDGAVAMVKNCDFTQPIVMASCRHRFFLAS